MVFGVLGALNNYGFGVFFLPISRDLNLSRAETSMVFSAARLEGGIEAPLAGWLTDKLGPRLMLLAGNTLAGVGFILLGTMVHSFWALFVVWVFVTSVGFQTGFFTGIMYAMNSWFFRRRALAISIISSSNRVGGFLWTPILAFMVVSFGWRTSSIIAGIIILVLGTPLAFLYRRSPESMGLLPDGVRQDSAPGSTSRTEEVSRGTPAEIDFTVKEALLTPTYWVFAGAQFFRMLSFGAIAVHMIPMIVWKGQDELAAATLASIYPLVGIGLAVLFGYLGDRYSAKHVLGLATLVSAVGIALLAFGEGIVFILLFVVLYGVGEAGGSLNMALTGHYFGRKNFATLRGILNSITVLGPFVAPIYAGWVFDNTGSYLWALIPFFISKAIAGPLYMFIPKPKPPKRFRDQPVPAGGAPA